MTQPAPKTGPVSPGAFQRFGSSAPGLAGLFRSIQQSSRGVAEWIDGDATGSGQAPAFAHDHRGGPWGRPLGVGHNVPVRPLPFGSGFELVLNVPDPRPLSGVDLPDAALNGGYSYVDFWCYTVGHLTDAVIEVFTEVWADGRWTNRQAQHLALAAPGAGPVWSATKTGLHLPPGLVRVTARDLSPITAWEWSALVVPQR